MLEPLLLQDGDHSVEAIDRFFRSTWNAQRPQHSPSSHPASPSLGRLEEARALSNGHHAGPASNGVPRMAGTSHRPNTAPSPSAAGHAHARGRLHLQMDMCLMLPLQRHMSLRLAMPLMTSPLITMSMHEPATLHVLGHEI